MTPIPASGPLWNAIHCDDMEGIIKCLNDGVDPNTMFEGSEFKSTTCLLMHALMRSNLFEQGLPQMLVDRGANINLRLPPTFNSLLTECAARCPPQAVDWLLDQKPHLFSDHPHFDPPLLEVLEMFVHLPDDHGVVSRVLTRAPSFKSFSIKVRHQLLTVLSKSPPPLLNAFHEHYGAEMMQWNDEFGKTIFHKMCARYPIRFESIEHMMALGAHLHQEDEEGNTPLSHLESFHRLSTRIPTLPLPHCSIQCVRGDCR